MSPKSLTAEERAKLAGLALHSPAADDARPAPPEAPPALRRKLDLRRIGGRHAMLDADLARTLERLAGESISVPWLECEAVAFGQLLWTMPPPTCLGVVQGRSIARAGGAADTLAVHLELDLFYALLDRLLQGAGSPNADARRPLTEVEQRLALRILRPLTAVWDVLWTGGAATSGALTMERVLSHPQRLQSWSTELLLAVNRYRVHGEGLNGTLQFIAPWDAAAELLEPAATLRRTADHGVVQEQLPSGEWTIELREQALAVEDLAALQPGDVLAADHPLNQPLQARGPSGVLVPVHLGRLGNEQAVKRV